MYFITPKELAGIDTMIPPIISFIVFIAVALATQKKYPGPKLHGVIEYVPPEEDVVNGEDLKSLCSTTTTTSRKIKTINYFFNV